MYIDEKKWVTDETLKDAIELRINECWPALNVCNAIAGAQTDDWKVVRAFSLVELLDEAKARKLPYQSFVGSVDGRKLTDAPIWTSALRHMPHLASPLAAQQAADAALQQEAESVTTGVDKPCVVGDAARVVGHQPAAGLRGR